MDVQEAKTHDKKKHRLYNRAKKSGYPEKTQEYEKMQRDSAKDLKRSRWKFINIFIAEGFANNSSHMFWKYMKLQRQDNFGIPPLKRDGILLTDSKTKDGIIVVVYPWLSSMSGGSSGPGGPADFHPRRNISGFDDLAPLRATAPAGKDCAGVGLSHGSQYISSSFRFRLSFSSTLAGQGSWAVLTTGTSPVTRRAVRAASLVQVAAQRRCLKLLLSNWRGRVTAGRILFARQHYVHSFGRQTNLGCKGSSSLLCVHQFRT